MITKCSETLELSWNIEPNRIQSNRTHKNIEILKYGSVQFGKQEKFLSFTVKDEKVNFYDKIFY